MSVYWKPDMPLPLHMGQVGDDLVMLTPEHRRRNLHVIGPIGSGKTRLLEHLIKQDIMARHAIVVIDPTGNLFTRLAQFCAGRGLQRRRKLHFWNPNDDQRVIGFNPLRRRPGEPVSRRVDSVVEACARVWAEDSSKTPLLKRILKIVFTALVEHDLTLVEGLDLLLLPTTDEERARRDRLTETENSYVRRVWGELDQLRDDRVVELFSSANNRLASFLTSPHMQAIFGLGEGSLDLATCMAEGHAVIINLADTAISTDNANVLGTLLINDLFESVRGRSEAEALAKPVYAVIDEAWRFVNEDIEATIDMARQMGLHLTLAHQRLGQLGPPQSRIRSGVLSIRNRIAFGDPQLEDARDLAEELFAAEYNPDEDVATLRRPTVTGYSIRRNANFRQSKGASAAVNVARGTVRGQQSGSNLGIGLPMDALGAMTGDFQNTGGLAEGLTNADSVQVGEAGAETRADTHGWAEALWPEIEQLPGALRSYDDQMRIHTTRLMNLPARQFVVRLKGQSPVVVEAPYVGDSVVRESRLPAFYAAAADASCFTWPKEQAAMNADRRRQRLDQQAMVVERDVPGSFWE